MRQSDLYTKTSKNAPSDEVSRNAALLIKAGFVHKEMAGVYSYLPLGLRVIEKIKGIVREEMNAIGGQEILLASLQGPDLWQKNDRWDDKKVDIWFKDKEGKVGFAWSHEEPMIEMASHHINSYKDLPVFVYQFQNKFRNEPRAKSGLLRTREFIMKDLYSFMATEKDLDIFYEKCAKAYEKVFKRVGIGDRTYKTFASGGVFTKYSHEFQSVSEAGEDTIYLDSKKKIAINKEVYTPEVIKSLDLNQKDLIETKSIEVGNIFKFGTVYSEKLGLKYKDQKGIEKPVFLGSYGIGIGRLMATVVELLSDEFGMVWPESIAPFRVHLIELGNGKGRDSYEHLIKAGVEVLYDDRDASAGEKFKDADLMGIPWRMVVSDKTKGKIEIKKRSAQKTELLSINEAIRKLI
ncbi:MAG: His/Gly/Thr/Pro-type tRNA ligase C-terminal domain-containing protein [Candidatus Colwellbacteria bacterium]|nr:His/Gly/Thr/Pro-type tRNA ligase C-terminal domain-containing protein [Candidatus Colwellbacteria bacterium]